MSDQPQNPTLPNASRIQAMLDDLSKARQGQPSSTPPAIPRIPPSPLPTPQTRPPVNLPTSSASSPQPGQAGLPTPPPSITPPPRPSAPPPLPHPAPLAPRPIPAPPAPPKPAIPQQPISPQTPFTAELRTLSGDISKITTGQTPEGMKTTPVPQREPIPTPASPAPIVIPPATSGGVARKALFGVIIIAFLALVVFGVLWMMGSGNEVAQTPTPSPTTTPVLSTKTLAFYFGNPTLPADSASFLSTLQGAQPPLQGAIVLNVQKDGKEMTVVAFLSAMVGSLPIGMESALATPWTALAYGQAEQFNASGVRTTSTTPSVRLILVVELANASAANQAMQSWETTGLASAFAQILGYTAPAQSATTFSSGMYQQIPVRYMNFSYPDRSIDYAIVLASNGKSYLVVTGSREALFYAIDRLVQ